MRGLSLVAASGGHSSSRCAGLSLSRPLLLRSTGSRRAGSVVVAHGPSCSAACGILPDQGSNPCPLHWQADSQPLCQQGSPYPGFLPGNSKPGSRSLYPHLFFCRHYIPKLHLIYILQYAEGFWGKELYLVPDLKHRGYVGLTRWLGSYDCRTAFSFGLLTSPRYLWLFI